MELWKVGGGGVINAADSSASCVRVCVCLLICAWQERRRNFQVVLSFCVSAAASAVKVDIEGGDRAFGRCWGGGWRRVQVLCWEVQCGEKLLGRPLREPNVFPLFGTPPPPFSI